MTMADSNRNKTGMPPRVPGVPGHPISVAAILDGRVRTFFGPGQGLGVMSEYKPPDRWIEPGMPLVMPQVAYLSTDLRLHPAPQFRANPDALTESHSAVPPTRIRIKNFVDLIDYEHIFGAVDAIITNVFTGEIEAAIIGDLESAPVGRCTVTSYRVPREKLQWASGPEGVIYDASLEDEEEPLQLNVLAAFAAAKSRIESERPGLRFVDVISESFSSQIAKLNRTDAFNQDIRPVDNSYTGGIVPDVSGDVGFLGTDFLHIHAGDPGFSWKDNGPRDEDDVLEKTVKAIKEAVPYFRRFKIMLWTVSRELPGFGPASFPGLNPPVIAEYFEQFQTYEPIYDPLSDTLYLNDDPPNLFVARTGPEQDYYDSPPGGGIKNPSADDQLAPTKKYGPTVCQNERKFAHTPTDEQLDDFLRRRAVYVAQQQARIEQVNKYYRRRKSLMERLAAVLPEYIEIRGDAREIGPDTISTAIRTHFARPVV
jgi:hypothetical protein